MISKKPKIEAIYPLNSVQQKLLFHHLTEGEDQGYLLVQCILDGDLDLAYLKQAWRLVTLRHEVMRTSVHWEKVARPVRLVRPEKEIDWSILDWRNKSESEQNTALEAYKIRLKVGGVDFEKNPLSKISIIQISDSRYYFLWECHHLLLDGWSSTIIINDAFTYYKNILSGLDTALAKIPSHSSYNHWLKNNSQENASEFWAKVFSDFKGGSLLQGNNLSNSIKNPVRRSNELTEEVSTNLKQLAREYKVTLNSLFQGIWSLALSKCLNTHDVTFGNTVSGRSGSFPNIDLMAGMFASVLPVRSNFESDQSFKSCLQTIQSQQQEARNYEHCEIGEITSWANIPEDKPLFDSLFVFENFPWEDITSGGIIISGFESGITTTYPITVIFKIEASIKYEMLVNFDVIPKEVYDWFFEIIPSICNVLLENKNSSIEDILDELPCVPSALSRKRILQDLKYQENFERNELNYVAPRNRIELVLVEIWEQLFGINYLSINDSFFNLGGKSFLSIKMFSLIEQRLGIKLPPTTLLESPTIEQLAQIINSGDQNDNTAWKFLVPIKTKGKKTPLFCIHAGGGHVFFYKGLADAIDAQRPVYALQPVGIFGTNNMHKSIEEMAKDYADEISLVQPEGTLNIVVYCFSTAVGLEMASYLKSKGRETNLIVADTIAEHRLLLDKERLGIRIGAFLNRFFANPVKALYEMIGFRVMFYINPIKVKLFGNEAEKNTERMRLHLVQLFKAYKWNRKIDSVSLILTKKVDKRYNQEIERSWKPLVDGILKVENCNGNHATFFESPDVLETAKAMDQVIMENV